MLRGDRGPQMGALGLCTGPGWSRVHVLNWPIEGARVPSYQRWNTLVLGHSIPHGNMAAGQQHFPPSWNVEKLKKQVHRLYILISKTQMRINFGPLVPETHIHVVFIHLRSLGFLHEILAYYEQFVKNHFLNQFNQQVGL